MSDSLDQLDDGKIVTLKFGTGPLGIAFRDRLVYNTQPGSQGQRQGVKIGWQIASVNDEAITSHSDLDRAMKKRLLSKERITRIGFLVPPARIYPLMKQRIEMDMKENKFRAEEENFKMALHGLIENPVRIKAIMSRQGLSPEKQQEIMA
ncbi:hypothetical protein AAMO2058_001597000, partial [Amorphochlora amoebiformis]